MNGCSPSQGDSGLTAEVLNEESAILSHLVLQLKVKANSGPEPLPVEIDIATLRLQSVSKGAGSDFVLPRVAEEDKPPRAGESDALR